MEHINFYEADVRVPVLKRRATRACLAAVVSELGYEVGEINYIFCSDKTLLKVNRQYLNHDTFTDIITFDYSQRGFFGGGFEEVGAALQAGMSGSAKGCGKKMMAGDIYISLDRVKENARMFHVKQVEELNRVLVHGILHLAGYKDKTPRDEANMHRMEDKMLGLCF